MRILYIDISLRGHRMMYLNTLVELSSECVALLPERSSKIPCKQILMKSKYDKKRNLNNYIRWISEIKSIVKTEKIDLVHFLCGDALYKFFGLYLGSIPVKTIVTYHHIQFSKLRNVSLNRIFNKTDMGVVHTNHLKESLNFIGISNTTKIEYPFFGDKIEINSLYAKKAIGLPCNKPCIVVLGGTQKYKGLDILLQALKKVEYPFYLYITGVERDITLNYIKREISVYSDSVSYYMKRLSDAEYRMALAATDYIVLPYRFEFDGASGPMVEGVWNRKYIIGAEHGSMGSIIKKYNLGRTFKTEDSDDLAKVLNEVLSKKETLSTEAEIFRKHLSVDYFLESYSKLYKDIGERQYVIRKET